MNPIRKLLQQRRPLRSPRRAGATAVQAALVLPMVVIFLLGAMEYARYLMTYEVFTIAAREGAEYAAKHTNAVVLGGTTYGNATSDVTNKVSNFLAGLSLTSQSVTVFESDSSGNNAGTWTDAQAGEYVCVQITGTYRFAVTSLLSLPTSVNLTFKAVALCEGN